MPDKTNLLAQGYVAKTLKATKVFLHERVGQEVLDAWIQSWFGQDSQLVCFQETTAPSSAWWWTSSRGRRTRSRAASWRSNG